MVSIPFKRVLLKISGEALADSSGFGISPTLIDRLAKNCAEFVEHGSSLCLVIGGGNIFRGVQGASQGMERATADYMGMLATVMNALALQNALEKVGIVTRVLSAISMPVVCESYIRRRAVRHMEKNRVVIFAAGTGNPYFTTDTAAALRASEMNCDVLMKGTRVDGVYEKDPLHFPDAEFYPSLSYDEVLVKNLKMMDTTSIALCRDNNIPIVVFSILEGYSLSDVLLKNVRSTFITNKHSSHF